MAKKVIWSPNAQKNRKKILQFWKENNLSNTYSIKLNELFEDYLKIISKHPMLGRKTSVDTIRIGVLKEYLMFYEIQPDVINLLEIWYNRQNTKKLKLKK